MHQEYGSMNPQTTHPHDSHGHSSSEEKRGFYRRYSTYIWVGGILALVAVVFGAASYYKLAIREPYTGLTFTAKIEVLKVTIVERGNLESAENSDITCRVQARTKGSTIASTIKWVIDDGTLVKAGDL